MKTLQEKINCIVECKKNEEETHEHFKDCQCFIADKLALEQHSIAGFLNKDNWKKHSRDMLFSHCLSRLARQLKMDNVKDTVEKYVAMQKKVAQEIKEIESFLKDNCLAPNVSIDVEAGSIVSILIDPRYYRILGATDQGHRCELTACSDDDIVLCLPYLQPLRKAIAKQLSSDARAAEMWAYEHREES